MAASYAIVSYLPLELSAFVNSLRQELNPRHAGKAAHITLLPPRPLEGHEEEALQEARFHCARFEPFDAEVTGVSSFAPINNVVFLAVGDEESELRSLHAALNVGRLWQQDPYPYVPHITIAQDLDAARTRQLEQSVSQRLDRYAGPLRFCLETLMFVRLRRDGTWVDLATVHLGPAHVMSR